jgi:hypothetical protein
VTVCVLASLLALPIPAAAQVATRPAPPTTIADVDTLRAAAVAKAASDREQRAQINDLLDRSDVREAARRMGLDIKRAKDVVATLEGKALADLSAVAKDARADLAGGNRTVTISVTTLLLLLILIVLIAD